MIPSRSNEQRLRRGRELRHRASGEVWQVVRVEDGAKMIVTREGVERRVTIPYWLDEHQWGDR